jgi:hypothetical protein
VSVMRTTWKQLWGDNGPLVLPDTPTDRKIDDVIKADERTGRNAPPKMVDHSPTSS